MSLNGAKYTDTARSRYESNKIHRKKLNIITINRHDNMEHSTATSFLMLYTPLQTSNHISDETKLFSDMSSFRFGLPNIEKQI